VGAGLVVKIANDLALIVNPSDSRISGGTWNVDDGELSRCVSQEAAPVGRAEPIIKVTHDIPVIVDTEREGVRRSWNVELSSDSGPGSDSGHGTQKPVTRAVVEITTVAHHVTIVVDRVGDGGCIDSAT